MHFATNIVREIYLAISIGDHASFRVDEYAGLHPDLFEKRGYGWHIDNNPGASMMGAIPYSLNRWWIDGVVDSVRAKRSTSESPPAYDSPWPLAREFYANAWRRGLDFKLGLAAFVMQALCMAPISALGVVLMFGVLRKILASDRPALWFSLLYAFGTPIFFRTGTLNQNLLTAQVIFAGFVVLWNPDKLSNWSPGLRFFLAGLAGGIGVLLDSSGVVLMVLLFLYGWMKHKERRMQNLLNFCCGALPALALLCFYQWKSFGNPFFPAQYHMPAINPYAQTGFHGYVGVQPRLLWALLFDYRYGLFLSCPLLLLSFASFRISKNYLPKLEFRFLFVFFIVLLVFFSGVNYTNLQFNTGVRYLVAIIPFLFVPTAIVLMKLSPRIAILISVPALIQSWCLAMYRDVERGAGIAEPLIRIFREGPQLPALTTIYRMKAFRLVLPYETAVIAAFVIAGCVLYFVWRDGISVAE